jgi:hypothetical protein
MNDQFNMALADMIRMLPNIIGALLILLAGWLIARGVRSGVTGLLRRMHVDKTMAEAPGGQALVRSDLQPSRMVGRLAYWAVWLGAIALAVSVLGIPALTAVMAAVYAYLPNVAAAAIILVAALMLATSASQLIGRLLGGTPTAKLLGSLVPGVILSIAGFMVLTQLQIAPAIVLITYTALIGGLALGGALAFGLGGRDVAGRVLQQAYYRGTERMEQMRLDLALTQQQQAQMATPPQAAPQPTAQPTAQPAPPTDIGRPAPAPGQVATAFGESIESFRRPEPKAPTDVRHPDSNH